MLAWAAYRSLDSTFSGAWDSGAAMFPTSPVKDVVLSSVSSPRPSPQSHGRLSDVVGAPRHGSAAAAVKDGSTAARPRAARARHVHTPPKSWVLTGAEDALGTAISAASTAGSVNSGAAAKWVHRPDLVPVAAVPDVVPLQQGTYEDMIEELGSGMIGCVWRGTWQGQPVAIKLFEISENSAARSLLASLPSLRVAVQHLHVVSIFCADISSSAIERRLGRPSIRVALIQVLLRRPTGTPLPCPYGAAAGVRVRKVASMPVCDLRSRAGLEQSAPCCLHCCAGVE